MRLLKLIPSLLALGFLILPPSVNGQFITAEDPYRSQLGILENVALADEASAVWTNPAGLSVRRSSTFFLSQSFGEDTRYTNVLLGWNNGGFGWQCVRFGTGARMDRWRFAMAGGDRAHGITGGMAVQLADPDRLAFGRYWSTDLGILARPFQWLSAGFVARQLGAPAGHPRSLETGLGLRPFGKTLTLAGGAIWGQDDPADDPSGWQVGALANFGPGVEIGVGVNQDRMVQAGLRLIFGKGALGGTAQRDRDGGYGPGWAVVRFSQDYRATRLSRRGNVAEIRLKGTIRDVGTGFSLLGGGTASLNGIITQIKRAAAAPDVGALYLRFEGLEIGQGMADELRAALVQFKEQSDKPIAAYLASADVREYYIASVADSIYLEPLGHLDLIGYAAHVVFLRRALNKLGVKPEFVRVGEYKSATEMFTDSTMSRPDREQVEELLDDYYDQLLDAIAKARDITTDSARTLIDNGPYTANDARARGLVDSVGHEEQAFESAKALARRQTGRAGDRVNMAKRRPYDERWGPRPKIAVVFASGDIISGEGGVDFITGGQFIGSETMVEALRRVREDDSIKGVVLRVDSPGGSALASDMIGSEVNKLRESDKPLVISVGDLAASGGYYIASPGDSIISNPGAIVGSIGIFSGKLALDSLYYKLGIDFTVLKRGENADIYSSTRPFTPEQRAKMQADVEQGYEMFVNRVAEGRGMTVAEVDSIGRGRIYSGERGIDRGLIDRIGGLEDAIQAAMHMAGIKDEAEIVPYPRRPTFWQAVMEDGPTGAWRWNWREDRLFYDPTAAMLR